VEDLSGKIGDKMTSETTGEMTGAQKEEKTDSTHAVGGIAVITGIAIGIEKEHAHPDAIALRGAIET
jgi:hypothetical protein